MIRAVACLGLFALLAGPAQAETLVALPKTPATLTLPDGWHRVRHSYKGIVEIFKHDGGALLVVTRADVPNAPAWIESKKQAYADEVESGIRAGVPGYKRTDRKLVDANGVPALDIEATRSGDATVVVRVLLFRTYAVSAAIEVPKGGNVTLARDAIKAFTPPANPPPAP